MTSAFLNGVTFKRGDGADPEVFSSIGEIKSISEIGKTNPLVDVTSFDSTAREYIAGLSDGKEISIECNYLPGNAPQQALITDVDNGSTTNFQLYVTDGTTPKTYSFAGVCLSWSINPSYEDANRISFTMKISGSITVS